MSLILPYISNEERLLFVLECIQGWRSVDFDDSCSCHLSRKLYIYIYIHNAMLRGGVSCLLFFREPYIGVTIGIQRAFDDFRSVSHVYYINTANTVIIRILIK